MTSAHYMAIACIAAASGVGTFFGALSADRPSMTRRKLAVAILLAMGALSLAFFLASYDHPVWAFLVAAYAAGALTGTCRGALESAPERVKRSLWLGALVLMAATTYFAYGAAERVVIAEDLIKKREAQAAGAIAELRKPWHADPSGGVVEMAFDRLKVWLAADTPVEIDAEYERELGEGAHREVPIRITFLNDSFLSVTGGAERGLAPLNWSVKVRNGNSGVLRSWDMKEAEPRALQPAERRDYQISWDSRDAKGDLLAAGDYTILLEVTTAEGQEARELPFKIRDSGPIETVEVDATTQYIRHQEQMTRSLQSIQEGMRMLDQMRFQRFPR